MITPPAGPKWRLHAKHAVSAEHRTYSGQILHRGQHAVSPLAKAVEQGPQPDQMPQAVT